MAEQKKRGFFQRLFGGGEAPREEHIPAPGEDVVEAIDATLTPVLPPDQERAAVIRCAPDVAGLAQTRYGRLFGTDFNPLLLQHGTETLHIRVVPASASRRSIPPAAATATSSSALSHMKDWRRVATRYDKLARHFRATITLAALLIWRTN